MNYEQATGQPRGRTLVVLEINKPDGYLRREYDLPDPYTVDEYTAALDDLHARYEAGERMEDTINKEINEIQESLRLSIDEGFKQAVEETQSDTNHNKYRSAFHKQAKETKQALDECVRRCLLYVTYMSENFYRRGFHDGIAFAYATAPEQEGGAVN